MFPNMWLGNKIYLDYINMLHKICENMGFWEYTFRARNFRRKKEIFVVFLDNFWSLWHFNFSVQPKYYFSRRFNFVVWPKYHNSWHASFAVVLKIKFFVCMSFQYFRNFGKSKKPKSKFKCIFIFFCTLNEQKF